MSEFVIQTKRLGLRPHRCSDVDFMIELNADPEVNRYTGDSALENKSEAELIISNLIQQFTEKKMGRFVVVDLNNQEELGWCGLKWLTSEASADLGYRFFRRHWGKGFASEAARGCLMYGFDTIGLDKIVAVVHPGNRGSIHVLEKLGFTLDHAQNNDSDCDLKYVLERKNYSR